MSVTFFDDNPTVAVAIQNYVAIGSASLPESVRAKVLEASGGLSIVDRVVFMAEALYANRDELDSAGRDMAAQLAQWAATNGWHGMGTRGAQIAAAMQRDNLYDPPAGSDWPAPADDPEALSQYAVAPAETPTPPA